tara:strand:- start:95 stop:2164 length:2070 start_codon:yes stop_codon:yes gene_type:complete
MGNKESKPKDLIPFDIRDEKNKFKLPNVLHLTAAKLISQAKFSDLEKLHDKKYCDEMIILTSKVLRHHLNSQEVLWLDRSLRDNNNEPIENFKTEPLVHLDNQSVKDLDEQGKEKKQHMCTGIARYYIKIAHLFAAINKTVNPMISWKNSDGKQLTPVMNKSEVPKGVRTTLSKLNFCTQRIASIKPLHNTDKNILIKAKNCNMNIKTENIQTGGGDPVPTVTLPETEETGFFQGMVDGANNMLDNAINTSKDLISNTTEKTKEAFSNVTEKTKDVAGNIMEKAENIKDTVPTENPVSNLMTDKELDSDTEETPTEENPPAETSTEEKPAEEQKVVDSPVLAEGEPPLEDKSQNNVVTEEAKQEMEKIQTAKKEKIKEENTAAVDNHKKTVTKALTDEIGIPELEALYFDVYNFKKGVFDQKSKESEGQYNKDVATFYKTFSLSEKVPPEIKKFSDIKLKDFHNQPLCNDKNSPWAKSYHSTPNHKDFELFKTYAKHITDMTFKNKQNEQKLVTIVDQIFAYWIDPETKVKQLTIDPQLTYEKLDKLIPETRDIIVQLYVECEKDFQEGLNILEAIIKKRMLVNAENRVERFQKKRDAMLENDMLQETEPTPSPDAVGASDVKIETEEEKELMQDEENKEEKKEKYNPVVDATEVTVNDKPVIEEPKPHEEAPETVENAPIPDQVVGNT